MKLTEEEMARIAKVLIEDENYNSYCVEPLSIEDQRFKAIYEVLDELKKSQMAMFDAFDGRLKQLDGRIKRLEKIVGLTYNYDHPYTCVCELCKEDVK
jgi:hypothetical protein